MNKTSFHPKISIITIVYNGVDLLEGTIQSVASQSYSNIEYLIIDGGSKDGTLDLIHKHGETISKWISEPDKGLYDAMNKGLKLATGDFVWFMNAGDHILKPDTVEKMVAACQPNTDIIYGEVMLVNEERQYQGTRSELTTQKLPAQLNWKSLNKGMVVCHQGFLPKRSLAPSYLLDNLSADIDWVIQCLKEAKVVTNTKLVVAEYLMGGISKQHHKQSLKDRYAILTQHYGFVPNLWNHFMIVLRSIFSSKKY